MSAKTQNIIRVSLLVLVVGFFLLILIAYLNYHHLKEAFLAEVSSAATSFIGQRVSIADLSFDPDGSISLHNITVGNPRGFPEGNLLTIRKLSLTMRYKELLGKMLYFERIRIQAPELFLLQNSEGAFNVSDKLREFFQRQPTLRYRIDEFTIQSGIVDINNDKKFRNEKLDVEILNLSSEPDTKTSIHAHTRYGDSRIGIEGWVSLKHEPRMLNVSISTQDFSLSPFKDFLRKFAVVHEETTATVQLRAEGDTFDGITISSEATIREARFAFLKKEPREILIRIKALLRIRDNTLVIHKASLDAAGIVTMSLKGDMRKFREDFTYSAVMNLDGLDLSAINFGENAVISGTARSDNLHIRGSLKKTLPECAGVIQLRKAQILTPDFSIAQMDATGEFLSGKSGTLSIAAKELQYGKYVVPWVEAQSGIRYGDGTVAFESPSVKSPDFTVSSDHATIRLPIVNTWRGVRAQITGMHALYPEKHAGIKNAALSLTVNEGRSRGQRTLVFSADEVMFGGVRTGFIEGTAHLGDTQFSIDIPQAGIFGGSMRFAAQGKTFDNAFPMKITLRAEHLDLGRLSDDISRITGKSFPLSGLLETAAFEGTVDSPQALRGKAVVHAEKIAVANENKERAIIREGAAQAEIDFKGEDLELRADAAAGRVRASLSGTVNAFAQKTRSGAVKIMLPEVSLYAVRESFWDVFPDSMLYTGLDGSLASEMLLQFNDASVAVKGQAVLKNVVLTGENDEYTVGPINGTVPVLYSKKGDSDVASHTSGGGGESGGRPGFTLPSFEGSEFQHLSKFYAQTMTDSSYHLVTIGAIRFGFPLLDSINIWIKPDGKYLNIGRFSGNIVGGNLNGSAVIDLGDVFQFKAGLLIEGLSLRELCDRIEPIRGYITGKVDGIATVKGSSEGLSRLIGKADFWTYSTEEEKTKISGEFLQKIGGASLRRYLGDRKFDKGVMNLYLQNGYVIFRELEISNRNLFGMRDLDIKVAPLSNRISLDHLMWSITEAAYRAKEKEQRD